MTGGRACANSARRDRLRPHNVPSVADAQGDLAKPTVRLTDLGNEASEVTLHGSEEDRAVNQQHDVPHGVQQLHEWVQVAAHHVGRVKAVAVAKLPRVKDSAVSCGSGCLGWHAGRHKHARRRRQQLILQAAGAGYRVQDGAGASPRPRPRRLDHLVLVPVDLVAAPKVNGCEGRSRRSRTCRQTVQVGPRAKEEGGRLRSPPAEASRTGRRRQPGWCRPCQAGRQAKEHDARRRGWLSVVAGRLDGGQRGRALWRDQAGKGARVVVVVVVDCLATRQRLEHARPGA
mmetsp:Transcript_2654/g.8520  ORF Transcript_2654/g.8520 Transcript_2654/m.8520 type:complete len:287 (+) Transcript_2654:277-1137(+)